MLPPLPESLLLWGAIAAAGTALFAFAWLFASALHEGADNYAAQMGAETSRQFEEVFLFVSPEKIARLGRRAALAAFFLFFKETGRPGQCLHSQYHGIYKIEYSPDKRQRKQLLLPCKEFILIP